MNLGVTVWPWNKTTVQPVKESFISQIKSTANEIKCEVLESYSPRICSSGHHTPQWMNITICKCLSNCMRQWEKMTLILAIGGLAASSWQCASPHNIENQHFLTKNNSGYSPPLLARLIAPCEYHLMGRILQGDWCFQGVTLNNSLFCAPSYSTFLLQK